MSTPLGKTLNSILTSAELPTLPTVASRILELTVEEDTPLGAIASLIAQDVALTAKVLRVANSALYHFPQRITSVTQAVSLLGINAVRSLVLSFTFLSMGKQQPNSLFDLDRFWQNALIRGVAARLLAEQAGQVSPEEMFTVALLQNIGHLIFALTVPTRYDAVLEQLSSLENQGDEITLEEECLGLAHTTSGFEVARFWGLPSTILTAIRYHHAPHTVPGHDPLQKLTVNIVYLSDLAAHMYFSTEPNQFHQRFHAEAEQLLGLNGAQRSSLLSKISREIEKTARFFDVTMAPVRSVAEIIQEANIRLGLLNLSYEEMHRELEQAKNALEHLREQLAERNRLLERLANLDSLTEISNHRFFQGFLQTEINRSARNNAPLSLLLADIDHFKQLNDTHGHQTGDFILKELCRVAQGVIRQYDLMARYGGEEFAFVLPETDVQQAVYVAQKLCQTIADHDFYDGRTHYRVTVSIGVASIRPGMATCDKGHVIDMADQAMYGAKKRGRNQVLLYERLR
jgi:diguanylate cyclase (GGDEF)-like protein